MAEPQDQYEPLNNHLGWQGWQLDLPASWNPVHFQGNARRGSLVVADLDRQRLALTWRPVRPRSGVDLSRLIAGPAGRRLAPIPAPPGYEQRGFADVRLGRTAEGEVVGMFLSPPSSHARLLLVRLMCSHDTGPTPPAERIQAGLADALDADPVPWCVYGFAWAVPAGFHLCDQHIVSGLARFRFRRGRSVLSFERRFVASSADPSAVRPASSEGATVVTHLDHEVRVVPVSGRRWWDRMISGPRWVSQWICPQARRQHRVEAAGPDARLLVEQASRSVACHAMLPVPRGVLNPH